MKAETSGESVAGRDFTPGQRLAENTGVTVSLSIKETERFSHSHMLPGILDVRTTQVAHAQYREVNVTSLNYLHREKVKRFKVMYTVYTGEGESVSEEIVQLLTERDIGNLCISHRPVFQPGCLLQLR